MSVQRLGRPGQSEGLSLAVTACRCAQTVRALVPRRSSSPGTGHGKPQCLAPRPSARYCREETLRRPCVLLWPGCWPGELAVAHLLPDVCPPSQAAAGRVGPGRGGHGDVCSHPCLCREKCPRHHGRSGSGQGLPSDRAEAWDWGGGWGVAAVVPGPECSCSPIGNIMDTRPRGDGFSGRAGR